MSADPSIPGQGKLPPRHLNAGELVHWIAAQEIMTKGLIAADTAELLVFFAPRVEETITPISDKVGMTHVAVSIVGAGRAYRGGDYVDAKQDVAKNGGLSNDRIDQLTIEVAQTAKKNLRALMVATVAREMNEDRKRRVGVLNKGGPSA